MFRDTAEIETLLGEAGFSSTGADGEGLVRREGRGCAIVKAMK
jgi:hypothetical protein